MRIHSLQPARTWEHSLLSGNGEMGLMCPGAVGEEHLILGHSALFLPFPHTEKLPDFKADLPRIRELCRQGRYAEAQEYVGREWERTGNKYEFANRDPFIGACELKIAQPGGAVSDYRRSVDFATGEVRTEYRAGGEIVVRRAFVSRADNLIAVKLSSGADTAELLGIPPRSEEEKKVIVNAVTAIISERRADFRYFQMKFRYTNTFNPLAGVEAVARVANDTVLIKICPFRQGETGHFEALREELNAIVPDYDALLARHVRVHGELMNRVSLHLDAPEADRLLSIEELNLRSLTQTAPLAKIERAFAAGYYNFISCCGANPPNLQGVWNGKWLAEWNGSYTTNGNMPCAMSFANMGNLPEMMESLFRFFERHEEGFRRNAREAFDCRGFHVPAQMTSSPLLCEFIPRWPHCWSQASAPWFMQFYFDHYQYTGDEKFLRARAYPRMKETLWFYEDYLTLDGDGKFMISPSYSPENNPAGQVQTAINATIEFACLRQLLRNLITAAEILRTDAELIPQWRRMQERIPDYQVSPDGFFREWLWEGLAENNEHRHVSQLYPLYDEMPSEILGDPALVRAAERTIRARMDFNEYRSTTMAFGYVQNGLAACHIGNVELAEHIINFLTRKNWTDGMGSFHDWEKIFNMDISGGFPYLAASGLVYSDPGTVRLFPAKPASWRSGSLNGVKLRGNVQLVHLSWDGDHAAATFRSNHACEINVVFPGGEQRVRLKPGCDEIVNIN